MHQAPVLEGVKGRALQLARGACRALLQHIPTPCHVGDGLLFRKAVWDMPLPLLLQSVHSHSSWSWSKACAGASCHIGAPGSQAGCEVDLKGIGVFTPALAKENKRFSFARLHVPHEGAIQIPRMESAASSIKCTSNSRSFASAKSKTQMESHMFSRQNGRRPLF